MNADALQSNLNRAIYYWDWYLLKGDVDQLVAAANLFDVYVEAGGTEYAETRATVKKHIEHLTKEAESLREPEKHKPQGLLDLTGDIISYENGELDEERVVELFQKISDFGLQHTLQGSYGRTLADLRASGQVQ